MRKGKEGHTSGPKGPMILFVYVRAKARTYLPLSWEIVSAACQVSSRASNSRRIGSGWASVCGARVRTASPARA